LLEAIEIDLFGILSNLQKGSEKVEAYLFVEQLSNGFYLLLRVDDGPYNSLKR
jgi:hypothetical protein